MTRRRSQPARHGHKLRVFTYLDPDQFEALDRIAQLNRTSVSSEIRSAVDLFLAINRSRTPSPVGPTDDSERAA